MNIDNLKKNIEIGTQWIIDHDENIIKKEKFKRIRYIVKLMDAQFKPFYIKKFWSIQYYTLDNLIKFIETVQYPISWIDQVLHKVTKNGLIIEITLVYKHYQDNESESSFHVAIPC